MNARQQLVLGIGALAILAILLFPPWLFVLDVPPSSHRVMDVSSSQGHEHVERPAGYHSLLAQHVPQDPTALADLFAKTTGQMRMEYVSMKIDRTRLSIQVTIVILLIGIITLFLRRPKE